MPYLLDAIRAYEEGVGSIEDIDSAMKLGCGYPMGPFTLLDFVGLDTTYYITHVMYDEFKERRFASPPLLKRLVMAGWYGQEAGKGFYDYADPDNPKANPKPNKFRIHPERRQGRPFPEEVRIDRFFAVSVTSVVDSFESYDLRKHSPRKEKFHCLRHR